MSSDATASVTPIGLLQALAASDLFVDLTPHDLAIVRDEVTAVHLEPGDVLVARGAVARELYVIVSGELLVELEGRDGIQQLSRLGPGAVVGEIGLLGGDGRAASVRAVTSAELVSLSDAGLRCVLAEHPEQAEQLARRATDRFRRTQLIEHVTSAFGVIDIEALAVVESLMDWVHLAAGDRLFAQGEVGDAAYLVATGRLSVCRSDETTAAQRELDQVARGDIVGELALLDGQPRNASVYAVRDTSLIRFTRTAFDELLARYPRVGLEVAKIALRRTRGGGQPDADRHRSIAVAAVSPGIDLGAFIEGLTTALGDDARHITSATLDAELGRAGAAQIGDDDIGSLRLAYHLESLEERHRYLVHELDSDLTPWSRRALRLADHILFVADATDDPTIGRFEAQLYELVARQRHPRVSLALLHPAETARPHDTPRWLEHRLLTSHHHVRRGDAAHMARLARLLAGTATSLVLGGGGARGLAHLGVLRALDELGIPIDMVGGTSIGSIMGLQAGMGWTVEEAEAVAMGGFGRLNDYTLPVAALLRGGRITAMLTEHFGGVDITDLWVPYYCVAANLTDARVEYLDHGPLTEALRASISIPGVLPPVSRDGRLYVDGGIVDNIPVAEMRRRNPTGTVIAVDVAPDDGPEAVGDYGMSVSGFRALLARRRGAGPPSLMSTMVRSSLVASAGERERVIREGVADLYLEVPVECSNPLDFSIADRVLPATADAVREILRTWVASAGPQREPRGTTPQRIRSKPPRQQVIDPGRRRRRRGVLLLTLRDVQLRAARFAAVVLGIAVVLTLLYLMTGLTEQFHREPRDTVAAFGADAWMVREGVSGAFTSAATMPADSGDAVEGANGTPVVLARHSIIDDGSATDVVIAGFRPGGLGEPVPAHGRLPRGSGEVVVDDASGLQVGDEAVIGGTRFVVSGLTDRRTMFAGMPLVFVPIDQAQDLVYRGQPVATAVLLDAPPPSVPAGFQLLTPEEIAADAMRPLERSISSVNLVRVLLWLVAGLVIGTMTYLSALERRRDVAVLKAVGASTAQLGSSIALQGVVMAFVAAVAAAGLQMVVTPVFPLDVSVPGRAFVQVPAIAVVVSLLSGLVGLRKAVATDPALAFAGPGS